jgi:hypothetical protein
MARRAQQVGFHEGTENDITGQIDEAGVAAIENANGGAASVETDGAKKPKKTQEEKRADFSRLASGRVSRAIDALSSLLHLANTSSYDWYTSDRVRIFTALREKIDTVEASFAAAEQPTEGKKKTARQLSFRV